MAAVGGLVLAGHACLCLGAPHTPSASSTSSFVVVSEAERPLKRVGDPQGRVFWPGPGPQTIADPQRTSWSRSTVDGRRDGCEG